MLKLAYADCRYVLASGMACYECRRAEVLQWGRARAGADGHLDDGGATLPRGANHLTLLSPGSQSSRAALAMSASLAQILLSRAALDYHGRQVICLFRAA
jgi:hypothetical protein